MKLADYILITILIILSIVFLSVKVVNVQSDDLGAVIRYSNNNIAVINLTEETNNITCIYDDCPIIDYSNKTITMSKQLFTALNDDMVIEFKQNSIRVKTEDSPLNICSNLGWVDNTFQSIVCIPNSVVIKLIPYDEINDYLSEVPDFEI